MNRFKTIYFFLKFLKSDFDFPRKKKTLKFSLYFENVFSYFNKTKNVSEKFQKYRQFNWQPKKMVDFCDLEFFWAYREGKFKRGLRLQFLLILQNLFCRFLLPKLGNVPHMINPWIESSVFLFWRKKHFGSQFWKCVGNRQSEFHELSSNLINFKI